MNVLAKDIAELMGGKRVLGRDVRDYADLDAVVEAGLPKAARTALKHHFGAAAPAGLDLDGSYGAEASRATERLARLFVLAEQAFGDEAGAREFLTTPHDRLAGRSPVDCVKTELAFKQVETILDSIRFGLPA